MHLLNLVSLMPASCHRGHDDDATQSNATLSGADRGAGQVPRSGTSSVLAGGVPRPRGVRVLPPFRLAGATYNPVNDIRHDLLPCRGTVRGVRAVQRELLEQLAAYTVRGGP